MLADNSCPTDYVAIGTNWLGTVEGNYTKNGVEKTDPKWKGQIPVNPPVF